jgi:hypothetical protein
MVKGLGGLTCFSSVVVQQMRWSNFMSEVLAGLQDQPFDAVCRVSDGLTNLDAVVAWDPVVSPVFDKAVEDDMEKRSIDREVGGRPTES